MDPLEQFKVELEELLTKYGFNLSAHDIGADINLESKTHTLGYWEGSVPGKFVKW
jgi:hypothetical protein